MSRRQLLFGSLIVVLFLVPAMPLFLDPGDPPKVKPADPVVPKEQPKIVESLPMPAPPKERRLPIAGSTSVIVVLFDGSAYVETPDGKRSKFLAPLPSVLPTLPTAAPKTQEAPRPRGQLTVTDKGVIDIPADAVITFIGDDHVVTHDQVGNSTVYFVDGRIEKRDRSSPKK